MDASDLILFVQQETSIGYLNVAVITVLLYDFILTFPKELSYVWNASWTPGKVLYLFVRYSPFMVFPFELAIFTAFEPDETTCKLALYWYSWGSIILSLAGDAIVALRTWVIWNKSNVAGAALLLMWCGVATGVLYFNSGFLLGTEFLPSVPGFSGCIISVSNSISGVAKVYLPVVIYQALIFLATVARGIRHLRHSPAGLTTVLYRDAFLASTFLLAISVTSVIVALFGANFSSGFITIYAAFSLIIPARIILNIREAAMGVDDRDVASSEGTAAGTTEGVSSFRRASVVDT